LRCHRGLLFPAGHRIGRSTSSVAHTRIFQRRVYGVGEKSPVQPSDLVRPGRRSQNHHTRAAPSAEAERGATASSKMSRSGRLRTDDRMVVASSGETSRVIRPPRRLAPARTVATYATARTMLAAPRRSRPGPRANHRRLAKLDIVILLGHRPMTPKQLARFEKKHRVVAVRPAEQTLGV